MDLLKPVAGSQVPQEPKITPEMKRAAQEFEAIVLAQILAPMFEETGFEDGFSGGSAERAFRPLLVEEYSKSFAAAGGVGLADSILADLVRLQAAPKPEGR